MTIPSKLRVISYLAPNCFDLYAVITAYLGRVLQLKTQLDQAECDPLEDPLLLQDQLDLAFICGLPLTRYCQVVFRPIADIGSTCDAFPRYENRPIYFADAIASAKSDIKVFADLAGKTFCYNDLGSNSGYNLLQHRLIQDGHDQSFFNKEIQSGSHQRSIRWVVDGKADCAVIDSVVLEQELRDFPELSQQLRVVEVLGPSPMPPLVVAQRLGKSLIQQMQSALLQPDTEVQKAMKRFGVKRFAAVELTDYKVLRIPLIMSAIALIPIISK
jgi:phosphonate transport system substrate-binding protein